MKREFISESQGGNDSVAKVPYFLYEVAEYKAEVERKKKSRWMVAFFVALTLLCAVVLGELLYVHNSTHTDSNEVLTYESASERYNE